MVNWQQGDIAWVDYPFATGTEPGGSRPAVVVQCDFFNRSLLQTLVVVPLTSNVRREVYPGNVRLPPRDSLKKPSVASATHVGVIDKSMAKRRM